MRKTVRGCAFGCWVVLAGALPTSTRAQNVPAAPDFPKTVIIQIAPAERIINLPVISLNRKKLPVLLSLHSIESSTVSNSDGKLLPSGWHFLENPSPLLKKDDSVAQLVKPDTTPSIEQPSIGKMSKTLQAYRDDLSENTTGLWLPLGEMTPIAAFRSGGQIIIVADGRHPLDTTTLPANGPLNVTAVRVMETTTVVTLHVAGGTDPAILPAGAGWSISLAPSPPLISNIHVAQSKGALYFSLPPQDASPRAVTFTDPSSGRKLLLGLVRGGGIASSLAQVGPGFALRPSVVGVVVASDSDNVELRKSGDQFVLDAAGVHISPLLSSRAGDISPVNETGVSFASAPLSALMENYRQAWTSAAFSSPAKRFDARLRAAKAAAALGDRAGLDGALTAALRDQPEGAARLDVKRLQQVSALLNHYFVNGSPPEISANAPEDQFWRGEMELLQASLSNDVSLNKNEREKVASLLASGLSAVEHYPASLRKQILPAAAEFVSRYGSSAALGALIRCANIPEENLACAISASRRNDVTASTQLSKLEDDPDSHVWSGAREERVLSEQKAGKIAPDKAAEMLDNLIPAARLSDREKEVRLEELDAVLAAGNLQKAQSLIDEWGQIYPKCDADILPRKLVLATLLGKNSTGGDLGARIGFLKNTLEHVSSQSERNELLKSLAAQYEALGLAGQAVDVFRSLLPQLPNSEQADTRIKMASLELSTGGADQVHQDLAPLLSSSAAAGSALPGGTPSVQIEAAILDAKASLHGHDLDRAVHTLEGLSDVRAQMLLAQIAETRQAWPEAVSILQRVLDQQIPTDKPVISLTNEQQQLVIHMAEDISHAGNRQAGDGLRARFGKSMSQGAMGSMFNLLTGADTKTAKQGAGG
ncbi:tetratricopeptide repeat protein [Gluconobacter wancherniae]|uniref:Uncharacterized protein n=1 Tax=Gluconobacter wancherniae NBRC 103581 TaxID=656744 RepID=A0A511B2K1_9PROT|nr:hypothetical protein [Gluconobacter wancherniae]MBF0854756.1 hypothetical protein [Gluconobacter wancherniae]GBD57827.1 hypothetical protein NBRC103581_02423 [Gluconobacter wancherniae NBRC 103581]GEK94646.1 hypothetical protein GWA01_24160 [Gluconobacter wancherniae NBRC 103581]